MYRYKLFGLTSALVWLSLMLDTAGATAHADVTSDSQNAPNEASIDLSGTTIFSPTISVTYIFSLDNANGALNPTSFTFVDGTIGKNNATTTAQLFIQGCSTDATICESYKPTTVVIKTIAMWTGSCIIFSGWFNQGSLITIEGLRGSTIGDYKSVPFLVLEHINFVQTKFSVTKSYFAQAGPLIEFRQDTNFRKNSTVLFQGNNFTLLGYSYIAYAVGVNTNGYSNNNLEIISGSQFIVERNQINSTAAIGFLIYGEKLLISNGSLLAYRLNTHVYSGESIGLLIQGSSYGASVIMVQGGSTIDVSGSVARHKASTAYSYISYTHLRFEYNYAVVDNRKFSQSNTVNIYVGMDQFMLNISQSSRLFIGNNTVDYLDRFSILYTQLGIVRLFEMALGTLVLSNNSTIFISENYLAVSLGFMSATLLMDGESKISIIRNTIDTRKAAYAGDFTDLSEYASPPTIEARKSSMIQNKSRIEVSFNNVIDSSAVKNPVYLSVSLKPGGGNVSRSALVFNGNTMTVFNVDRLTSSSYSYDRFSLKMFLRIQIGMVVDRSTIDMSNNQVVCGVDLHQDCSDPYLPWGTIFVITTYELHGRTNLTVLNNVAKYADTGVGIVIGTLRGGSNVTVAGNDITGPTGQLYNSAGIVINAIRSIAILEGSSVRIVSNHIHYSRRDADQQQNYCSFGDYHGAFDQELLSFGILVRADDFALSDMSTFAIASNNISMINLCSSEHHGIGFWFTAPAPGEGRFRFAPNDISYPDEASQPAYRKLTEMELLASMTTVTMITIGKGSALSVSSNRITMSAVRDDLNVAGTLNGVRFPGRIIAAYGSKVTVDLNILNLTTAPMAVNPFPAFIASTVHGISFREFSAINPFNVSIDSCGGCEVLKRRKMSTAAAVSVYTSDLTPSAALLAEVVVTLRDLLVAIDSSYINVSRNTMQLGGWEMYGVDVHASIWAVNSSAVAADRNAIHIEYRGTVQNLKAVSLGEEVAQVHYAFRDSALRISNNSLSAIFNPIPVNFLDDSCLLDDGCEQASCSACRPARILRMTGYSVETGRLLVAESSILIRDNSLDIQYDPFNLVTEADPGNVSRFFSILTHGAYFDPDENYFDADHYNQCQAYDANNDEWYYYPCDNVCESYSDEGGYFYYYGCQSVPVSGSCYNPTEYYYYDCYMDMCRSHNPANISFYSQSGYYYYHDCDQPGLGGMCFDDRYGVYYDCDNYTLCRGWDTDNEEYYYFDCAESMPSECLGRNADHGYYYYYNCDYCQMWDPRYEYYHRYDCGHNIGTSICTNYTYFFSYPCNEDDWSPCTTTRQTAFGPRTTYHQCGTCERYSPYFDFYYYAPCVDDTCVGSYYYGTEQYYYYPCGHRDNCAGSDPPNDGSCCIGTTYLPNLIYYYSYNCSYCQDIDSDHGYYYHYDCGKPANFVCQGEAPSYYYFYYCSEQEPSECNGYNSNHGYYYYYDCAYSCSFYVPEYSFYFNSYCTDESRNMAVAASGGSSVCVAQNSVLSMYYYYDCDMPSFAGDCYSREGNYYYDCPRCKIQARDRTYYYKLCDEAGEGGGCSALDAKGNAYYYDCPPFCGKAVRNSGDYYYYGCNVPHFGGDCYSAEYHYYFDCPRCVADAHGYKYYFLCGEEPNGGNCDGHDSDTGSFAQDCICYSNTIGVLGEQYYYNCLLRPFAGDCYDRSTGRVSDCPRCQEYSSDRGLYYYKLCDEEGHGGYFSGPQYFNGHYYYYDAPKYCGMSYNTQQSRYYYYGCYEDGSLPLQLGGDCYDEKNHFFYDCPRCKVNGQWNLCSGPAYGNACYNSDNEYYYDCKCQSTSRGIFSSYYYYDCSLPVGAMAGDCYDDLYHYYYDCPRCKQSSNVGSPYYYYGFCNGGNGGHCTSANGYYYYDCPEFCGSAYSSNGYYYYYSCDNSIPRFGGDCYNSTRGIHYDCPRCQQYNADIGTSVYYICGESLKGNVCSGGNYYYDCPCVSSVANVFGEYYYYECGAVTSFTGECYDAEKEWYYDCPRCQVQADLGYYYYKLCGSDGQGGNCSKSDGRGGTYFYDCPEFCGFDTTDYYYYGCNRQGPSRGGDCHDDVRGFDYACPRCLLHNDAKNYSYWAFCDNPQGGHGYYHNYYYPSQSYYYDERCYARNNDRHDYYYYDCFMGGFGGDCYNDVFHYYYDCDRCLDMSDYGYYYYRLCSESGNGGHCSGSGSDGDQYYYDCPRFCGFEITGYDDGQEQGYYYGCNTPMFGGDCYDADNSYYYDCPRCEEYDEDNDRMYWYLCGTVPKGGNCYRNGYNGFDYDGFFYDCGVPNIDPLYKMLQPLSKRYQDSSLSIVMANSRMAITGNAVNVRPIYTAAFKPSDVNSWGNFVHPYIAAKFMEGGISNPTPVPLLQFIYLFDISFESSPCRLGSNSLPSGQPDTSLVQVTGNSILYTGAFTSMYHFSLSAIESASTSEVSFSGNNVMITFAGALESYRYCSSCPELNSWVSVFQKQNSKLTIAQNSFQVAGMVAPDTVAPFALNVTNLGNGVTKVLQNTVTLSTFHYLYAISAMLTGRPMSQSIGVTISNNMVEVTGRFNTSSFHLLGIGVELNDFSPVNQSSLTLAIDNNRVRMNISFTSNPQLTGDWQKTVNPIFVSGSVEALADSSSWGRSKGTVPGAYLAASTKGLYIRENNIDLVYADPTYLETDVIFLNGIDVQLRSSGSGKGPRGLRIIVTSNTINALPSPSQTGNYVSNSNSLSADTIKGISIEYDQSISDSIITMNDNKVFGIWKEAALRVFCAVKVYAIVVEQANKISISRNTVISRLFPLIEEGLFAPDPSARGAAAAAIFFGSVDTTLDFETDAFLVSSDSEIMISENKIYSQLLLVFDPRQIDSSVFSPMMDDSAFIPQAIRVNVYDLRRTTLTVSHNNIALVPQPQLAQTYVLALGVLIIGKYLTDVALTVNSNKIVLGTNSDDSLALHDGSSYLRIAAPDAEIGTVFSNLVLDFSYNSFDANREVDPDSDAAFIAGLLPSSNNGTLQAFMLAIDFSASVVRSSQAICNELRQSYIQNYSDPSIVRADGFTFGIIDTCNHTTTTTTTTTTSTSTTSLTNATVTNTTSPTSNPTLTSTTTTSTTATSPTTRTPNICLDKTELCSVVHLIGGAATASRATCDDSLSQLNPSFSSISNDYVNNNRSLFFSLPSSAPAAAVSVYNVTDMADYRLISFVAHYQQSRNEVSVAAKDLSNETKVLGIRAQGNLTTAFDVAIKVLYLQWDEVIAKGTVMANGINVTFTELCEGPSNSGSLSRIVAMERPVVHLPRKVFEKSFQIRI